MSEAKSRKKLAIIDGKSVFYRGYYAMPNLSTKDGIPTGGVYGFSALALEMFKKLKPDYVAVAWDKPKTNIRKRLEMLPTYKAGRKAAPPDFYAQIPILYQMLQAFGWPLYEFDDYEADDIMATLAVKADKAGIETMLITSDLDALQCLGPHTHVYALKKGFSNIERFDEEYFKAKHGIETSQFLDLKSLKGDSSDNIPGVPGIGEKTAVELLREYQTLDGVYENLWQIKDSVRKKLEAGKDSAYLSKKVAYLMTDAPVDLDLDSMDTHKLDVHALRDLLHKLEFRSLLRALPEYMQAPAGEAEGVVVGTRSIEPSKVSVISDEKSLKGATLPAGDLLVHGFCAGSHGKRPEILIIGTKEHVLALDLRKIGKKATAEGITALLAKAPGVIGYDVKATLQMFLGLGVPMPKVSHDVLVGAFLLNSLRREQSLTDLATADLGYEGSPLEGLSPDDLLERAGEVSAVIAALHTYQGESMSELTKLIQLSDTVEWPVIPVLAGMEHAGVCLDTKYLAGMNDELDDSISDLVQQIYGHANKEFNIGSPGQLADILFLELHLPTAGIKKGKTGYSTAAAELDKLRGLHPIIDLITQYREVTKLKNTYVDALPKMVDEDGRVHTSFNLTIAQTGRLSSTDPNLQNIPVRSELGKKIRTAFTAKKGHVFISADYSQFELRLAAALSGDEGMTKAFNDDEDIHTLTAAAILGLPADKVTKELRYRAKAVNFGIIYGQGPHGLSQTTGMSFAESKEFIAKYFEIRPKLKAYLDGLRLQADKKGYVETLLGRRRPTPDVKSSNFAVREGAYRQAVNMPIQGTAADLTKLAMVKVAEKLPEGAQMLLQVHDSIMIEAPESQTEAVSTILKETMENIYELPVKLKADISVGKTWGEL